MTTREPSSEADLIDRCILGDELAWEDLVSRYQHLIYAIPSRMGLHPDDRAEVFQRVCVLLFRRLHQIREPAALPGWLVTTARREAWLVARNSTHTLLFSELDEERAAQLTQRPDDSPLPDTLLSDRERALYLWAAIDELPERCRSLLRVLLREDGARNYDDLASALGMPRGSIGPIRARCIARLVKTLEKQGILGRDA